MIIISKVFYPTKSVDVDASSPHPKGTKYRVSIGPENWGTSIGTVLKVQMIYNGKVSGRISPSYPLGTEDWKNVCLAVEDLQREYERTNRNRIYIPATQPKILPVSKYVALVRKIPKEKILREKDIENFFKQIYSEKTLRMRICTGQRLKKMELLLRTGESSVTTDMSECLIVTG